MAGAVNNVLVAVPPYLQTVVPPAPVQQLFPNRFESDNFEDWTTDYVDEPPAAAPPVVVDFLPVPLLEEFGSSVRQVVGEALAAPDVAQKYVIT